MRYQQHISKALSLSVLVGVSALSSLSAEVIPFETSFESPEYSTGFLVSDPIWTFDSSSLTVEITNVDALLGSGQSLLINGTDGFTFTATDPTSGLIRWVDFYVKPVFVEEADLLQSVSSLQSAVSAFVKSGSSGDVYVIDGDRQGSGVWVSAQRPLSLSGSTSQDWVRLSYRLNYATQTWDLYIDDALALYDLGFLDDEFAALNSFSLKSDENEPTAFDYFYVGAATPASFLDTDQDGIFDSVDVNPNLDDRYSDADGDNLSNIEEFRFGSSLTLRDTDSDLLNDAMELAWQRDPQSIDADLFYLDGDIWQSGFEIDEGYALGDLNQQLGWNAYGVDVTDSENAYAIHNTETEVFAEHLFGTDQVDRIWFSFQAKLHAGELPEIASLDSQTAAVFVFSDPTTLNVLNSSTGWIPYTVTADPTEWNTYAVFLNYQTKTWDLYLNGELVATDIAFNDASLQSLSRFKAAMQKPAGSISAAYMDDLELYSGDDFDEDMLGDDWERLYGFNPASVDGDGDGILDIHEDSDSDGLANLEEFEAGANPYLSDTDDDTLSDYLEYAFGRDLIEPATDLAQLAADGEGGLFWQTFFELNEGYVLGTLDEQLDWYSSTNVALTEDGTASIISSEDTTAFLERYFDTTPLKSIWFGFTGKFLTGSMPDAATLTEPAAAIFGFSKVNELSVLNPLGSIWNTYQLTNSAEDWNEYAVYFDYDAQSWEMYQNGRLVAENLDFADSSLDALTRFKTLLEKASESDGSAASYLDFVQVYAGDDFDGDGISDTLERLIGYSPATSEVITDLYRPYYEDVELPEVDSLTLSGVNIDKDPDAPSNPNSGSGGDCYPAGDNPEYCASVSISTAVASNNNLYNPPSYKSIRSTENFQNGSFESPDIRSNPRWETVDFDADLFSSIPDWSAIPNGAPIELHSEATHQSQSLELGSDRFYVNWPEGSSRPSSGGLGAATTQVGQGVEQEIDIGEGSYLLIFSHRARNNDLSFKVTVTVSAPDGGTITSKSSNAIARSTWGGSWVSISTDDLSIPPGTISTAKDFKLKVAFENIGLNSGSSPRIDRVELFEYSPDPIYPPFSFPLTEAAPPKYRKIGLNGRPLPDEKPQAEAETDEEPEETYVDALTLGLRHSVTDVYIPVPSSKLNLSVRRNWSGDVWNLNGGLRPHERIDLPFGSGWSSNVAPYIHFDMASVLDQPRSVMDTATVYDENGEAHTFVVSSGEVRTTTSAGQLVSSPAIQTPSDLDQFFPMPSGEHEQQVFLNSMTRDTSTGHFVLTKRYGTKLTYELFTPIVSPIQVASNRVRGSIAQQRHYYARLLSVEDAYGNKLIYQHLNRDLIPEYIGIDSNGDGDLEDETFRLTINSSGFPFSGLVKSIIDPRGNVISYTYQNDGIQISSSQDGSSREMMSRIEKLSLVSSPEEGRSVYTYDLSSETDSYFDTNNKLSRTEYAKLDLSSIEDANGNLHRFYYENAGSESAGQITDGYVAYSELRGYHLQKGRPRQVVGIDLPEVSNDQNITLTGEQDVVFTDASLAYLYEGDEVPPLGPRRRETSVIDAEGSTTLYTWYDEASGIGAMNTDSKYEFDDFYAGLSEDYSEPYLVTFPELRIQHDPTGLNLEESYVFEPTAAMALSQQTDISDNTTGFTYGDAFDANAILGFDLPADFDLYGKQPEPTAQTNTLGQTKFYCYEETQVGRIMCAVLDEEMRLTRYDIDTVTGQRTAEYMYAASTGHLIAGSTVAVDSSAALLQLTEFEYGDGTAAPVGFMTRKTVHTRASANGNAEGSKLPVSDGSADEDWVYPLVTQYIPVTDDLNNNGRVYQEIVDPDDLDGDGQSPTTTYTYDPNGNRRSVQDPRGFVTWFVYDDRNRLTEVYHPDGTTTRRIYDLRGNLVGEVDENGHITAHGYDALNRRIHSVRLLDASLISDVDDYQQYVGIANLSGSARDGVGLYTDSVYNDVNSIVQSADPNGNVSKFYYDRIHRLTAQQTPAVPVFDLSFGVDTTSELTTWFHYGANSGSNAFTSTGFKPTHTLNSRGFATVVEYDGLYRPVKTGAQYRNPLNLSSASPTSFPTTPYSGDVATDADFSASQTVYDEVGNATRQIDALGQITEIDYDGLNRPTQVRHAVTGGTYPSAINPVYGAVSTSYTSTGLAYQVEDENSRVTRTEFDAAARPVLVRQPAVYDALSEQSKQPETQTQYDPSGNAVRSINPLGNAWETAFDQRNRPVRQLQPLVYDEETQQWLQPASFTTYDGVGNPITVTDPRGFTTRTYYDEANRPTHVFTPKVAVDSGNSVDDYHLVTASEYDANGNVLTIKQGIASSLPPEGAVPSSADWTIRRLNTINTYDPLNRLSTSAQNGGTTDLVNWTTGSPEAIIVANAYDASGNQTRVVDGEGQTTHFAYDGLNRNTATRYGATSSTWVNGTALVYNALNQTHRLSGTTPGNDSISTFTSDSDSQITSYSYDDRHRLQQVDYADDSIVDRQYAYDQVGNILAVDEVDSLAIGDTTTADVAYLYDDLNRITAEYSAGHWMAYAYDLAGNRIQTFYNVEDANLTTPQDHGDGSVLSMPSIASITLSRQLFSSYDAHNRTESILEDTDADGVWDQGIERNSRYAYNAAGSMVKKILGNDDEVFCEYDALGRKVAESGPGSSGFELYKYDYTYDAFSNLASIDESYPSGQIADRIVVNSYDGSNRLVSEAIAGANPMTTIYEYDLANNRALKSVNENGIVETTRYIYSNELNQIQYQYVDANDNGTYDAGETKTEYTYDNKGNRVERTDGINVDTYTYDYENRLIELQLFSDPLNNGTYEYAYDYRTRRVLRDESSGVGSRSQIVFSGGTSVQEYKEGAGSPTVEYIRGSDYGGGIGGILYTVRNGVPSFKHYNSRGDVVAATDASGALTYQTAYEAFGQHGRTDTPEPITFNSGQLIAPSSAGGTSIDNLLDGDESTGWYGDGPVEINFSQPKLLTSLSLFVERLTDETITVTISFFLEAELITFTRTVNDHVPVVSALEIAAILPSTGVLVDRVEITATTNSNFYFTEIKADGYLEATSDKEWASIPYLDRQQANTKDEDPTGLLNEGFRYRDLETGTFITRDPLGFVDGPNVYTYVVQNPWTYFDPLGLAAYGMSISTGGGWQSVNNWEARAEATHQMVTGGVDYTVTTAKENFTEPASLISGGARGEFGELSANAIVIGGIALAAATVETVLDLFTGGSTKAPKQALKKGAKELGETIVESSLENTAKDIVQDNGENMVYRALREGEDPSLGLRARAPGSETSVPSHVMGKKESDLISTTKNPETALNTFNSGNGVVGIDLDKVGGEIIDASSGIGAGRVHSRTKSHQEVLIRDSGGDIAPIPPEAIKVIEEAQ